MALLDELLDYWRGTIERDLSPFADPGTRLEILGDRRALTVRWSSRSRPLEALFSLSLDGVRVVFQERVLSYRSFLASTEMADLLGLAKMILQAQSPDVFVATQARTADLPDQPPRPAVEMLQQLLGDENPASVTRIVMVTGEAGAGKTRVLQQLVREQADNYLRGRTDRLYLYINAQGRALARFNEALATELQDLRSFVTYHAVSALVRLGILVPIIDGFDELLGVGGYDDAFSSLTGFIEELNGQGQLIASARSSYYEQEFVARANTVSSLGAQAWTQVPIEVLSWGHAQFTEYVNRRAAAEGLSTAEAEVLSERVASVFGGRNEELRKKPLFVARTVDIVLKDPSFRGGEDLLKQLVTAYLDRERKEKLLDADGGMLLTEAQMELLFRNLAEEMWNQETRELDRRSVKEVAEYVLVTEGLSETTQRVVVERMPQLAFLMPGERRAGIAFEHEMFFSYFLAQVFAERLPRGADAIKVLLGRSVLPTEVAAAALATFAELHVLNEGHAVQSLLDTLAAAASGEGPRASQIRENAGLFGATLLKLAVVHVSPLSALRIRNLVFAGGDLRSVVIEAGLFDRVEFRRVDLTATRLVHCSAVSVVLTEVVVDPSTTRLELVGLDPPSQIVGLRVRGDGLLRSLYDPSELQKVLIAIGTIPAAAESSTRLRAVEDGYVALLERLVRAYRRTNPVCTADDNLKNLFRERHWTELEQMLVKHGVVTREHRATGGPPKVFLRRQVLPDHIMAGLDRQAIVPLEVSSFWEDLEKSHPKRARV